MEQDRHEIPLAGGASGFFAGSGFCAALGSGLASGSARGAGAGLGSAGTCGLGSGAAGTAVGWTSLGNVNVRLLVIAQQGVTRRSDFNKNKGV